jgi:hypothetical protein
MVVWLAHARVGHRQGFYQKGPSNGRPFRLLWQRRSVAGLWRAAPPATGHRQGFHQKGPSIGRPFRLLWQRRSVAGALARSASATGHRQGFHPKRRPQQGSAFFFVRMNPDPTVGRIIIPDYQRSILRPKKSGPKPAFITPACLTRSGAAVLRSVLRPSPRERTGRGCSATHQTTPRCAADGCRPGRPARGRCGRPRTRRPGHRPGPGRHPASAR